MSDQSWQRAMRQEWLTALRIRAPKGVLMCWDGPLERAYEEIAREAIESWDMKGVVPMPIWDLMSAQERARVRLYGSSTAALAVMGSVMALGIALTALGVCVSEGALVGAGLGIVIGMGVCIFMDTHGTVTPYGRMIAPGTASALKHAARTYEVANGMLTLASETQGGELTVATTGRLEVCDE